MNLLHNKHFLTTWQWGRHMEEERGNMQQGSLAQDPNLQLRICGWTWKRRLTDGHWAAIQRRMGERSLASKCDKDASTKYWVEGGEDLHTATTFRFIFVLN